MKIRQRDGTLREVAANYILMDGEALVVPMRFMDGGMICDARGQPAGTRPGFLFANDEVAERAVADAYREYDQAISERWRLGPGQQRSSQTHPVPQATFDSPEAARAAVRDAYRQYDEDIQNRWRSR